MFDLGVKNVTARKRHAVVEFSCGCTATHSARYASPDALTGGHQPDGRSRFTHGEAMFAAHVEHGSHRAGAIALAQERVELHRERLADAKQSLARAYALPD